MNQAHTDINLVLGQAPHRELTVAFGAVTRSKREDLRYREATQNHPRPNRPGLKLRHRRGRTSVCPSPVVGLRVLR
jgi:hypothetical protein